MTKIAIVNEHDQIVGAAEKAEARAQGLRHRIARVFLVNTRGEVLLQRRNLERQDSPGKWDQSAGGHVDAGEDYLTAARRETREELGITVTKLQEIGRFYIEREGPGGLIRRFQAVFMGRYDGPMRCDAAEVAEVRWVAPQEIAAWVAARPEDFTNNFGPAFKLLPAELEARA